MNRPTPRLHWHAPAARVRTLQGKFEVMLADARRDRAAATNLGEIVALTGVIHQVEQWIGMCREHLAAVRRRTGWGEHAPPGPSRRRAASPLPVHPSGVMPRRPSAGHAAGRLGVAGATPPPVMGQWMARFFPRWERRESLGSKRQRPALSCCRPASLTPFFEVRTKELRPSH